MDFVWIFYGFPMDSLFCLILGARGLPLASTGTHRTLIGTHWAPIWHPLGSQWHPSGIQSAPIWHPMGPIRQEVGKRSMWPPPKSGSSVVNSDRICYWAGAVGTNPSSFPVLPSSRPPLRGILPGGGPPPPTQIRPTLLTPT